MAKPSRTLNVYKSYVFKEKAPVIDITRTWVQDAGVTLKFIEEKSGVKVSTMRGWFHGKTRSPNFATVAAVARALGKNSIPLTGAGRKR